MRWSERQRAMLRAMGIELFERERESEHASGQTQSRVEATAKPAVMRAEAAVESRSPLVATASARETGTASARHADAAAPRDAETARWPPAESTETLAEADWLVVGEPIDAEADPSGAQGQLLDNLLRAIGASRSAPARNGRAAYLGLAEKPAGGGEAHRRDRAQAVLAAVKPRCVLALGRSAAHAFLSSDEPLGALRGRAHASAGVPVVVTCSLAFLLRHAEEKARAWADLCLAVRSADGAPA